MVTAQSVCSFLTSDPGSWSADWIFGLPLILVTVLINVMGLGLMGWRIVQFAKKTFERHHPSAVFLTVVCAMTLLATSLHALDAGIWAGAYTLLGTMPNYRSAMLYSLNAMTSYGHTSLSLEDRWELLGALEALNGALLFGLSTAFLFGVIQKVWSSAGREHW
jgi:hypothetical protein